MPSIKTYFISRVRSFGYAFKGIYTLFATQPNAKIHLLAIVVIGILGWFLKLSTTEWCFITACMGMVLLAEGMNTAIEFVVDLASPDHHELAGKAKDVAAGAVLISVIFCGIVWGIIYIPKILKWLLAIGS